MGNVASFTVSYEGKALESHAMDVRDLGPALLSFGQLFDEANRALNGDKVTIKLQVKATKEGSFNIEFEAIQSLASQISDFLNGEFVTSALNLKELILGSAGIIGLLGLIKKLKGGKPKEIKNLENDHVRILTADGTSIEVPFKSLSLYQQVNVRVATEKVLKPLENEGIDVFSVR